MVAVPVKISRLWLLLGLVAGIRRSECLKNVSIVVPVAVRVGESVTLKCLYDLEGESLYMVKWYKGRQEFYRFVPKELPNIRVFPVPAVNVDVNLSGANEVVLLDVRKDLAGKYRCEVSADAPSFHTQVVSSTMHVVHAADGVPNLILEKSRYSIGDTLRGNCTSPPSTPAANITWYINDKQVNATFHKRTRYASSEGRRDGDGDGDGDDDVVVGANGAQATSRLLPDLYATKAGLQMEVGGPQARQLRITCVADLFQTFSTRAQIVLHEERPNIASVMYTAITTTRAATATATATATKAAAATPSTSHSPSSLLLPPRSEQRRRQLAVVVTTVLFTCTVSAPPS